MIGTYVDDSGITKLDIYASPAVAEAPPKRTDSQPFSSARSGYHAKLGRPLRGVAIAADVASVSIVEQGNPKKSIASVAIIASTPNNKRCCGPDGAPAKQPFLTDLPMYTLGSR